MTEFFYILLGITIGYLLSLLNRKPVQQLILPPPSEPKSAEQTLKELKAQEKLEREYRFVSYWLMYGKRVNKPTAEQLSDPALFRVEKWVKRTPKKKL